MSENDWMVKVRAISVLWLLGIISYIIVFRVERPDDSQIVIGLILGAIITLIIGQIGVSLARRSE